MKYLTMIRHAKSSHAFAGVADFERPLNERGEAAADLMGTRLRAANFEFDQVFCSAARRAQQTCARIFHSDWADRVTTEPELYTFDEEDLLRFIELLDPQLERVVLVGHNPAATILVNELCRSQIDNIPTCGIAQMHLNINQWFEAAAGTGELIAYDYPKNQQSGH